ncbi:hypothetical protein PF005_g8365 [Phytophthora fragariae]|uniref:Secreted protein n=1 Tax=Phytophthora fragariae TaxID=53985 RepID=A0A6A3LBJ8_9STRA|nr:hypothetical protein PF003_g21270 [Phytophthora fragariae]KAE8941570.1 hypothetical protein PF009_g8638 [Phytophthora fragariae]KAE9013213.1 hypothetical protein PF011_g8585 [Phytophthora fragariae]KAE9120665.1 hypothetical protein PF007_g8070 [Phytophthora fragariae]KAE9125396.1 hypothetical protein PF010_g5633 [Phytophthora fragariae]
MCMCVCVFTFCVLGCIFHSAPFADTIYSYTIPSELWSRACMAIHRCQKLLAREWQLCFRDHGAGC